MLKTVVAKSVFSTTEKAVIDFFNAYKSKNTASLNHFDYDVRNVVFLKRNLIKINWYIANRQTDKITETLILSVSNYYRILSNSFGEDLTIRLLKSFLNECYWGIIGACVFLAHAAKIKDRNHQNSVLEEINHTFPGTHGMVWVLEPAMTVK